MVDVVPADTRAWDDPERCAGRGTPPWAGEAVLAVVHGVQLCAHRISLGARLSSGVTDGYPFVPWALTKRMRDRLVHHYEGTDYGAVWDTLVVELPAIRHQIAGLLDDQVTDAS